jgi:hypothetical protein
VLVVLALVLAAQSYVNTLRYQFVYDDLPQIVNNPRVHTWSHAEAEPYFRKAISLYAKPGYHWALAMSLVKQNELAAARDELKAGWNANPRPEVKQELEKVEKQLAAG